MTKICPHCQSPTIKCGLLKSGYQKYHCSSCKRYCSDSPERPRNTPIGDKPMTAYERFKNMSPEAMERWKARQAENQRKRRAAKKNLRDSTNAQK